VRLLLELAVAGLIVALVIYGWQVLRTRELRGARWRTEVRSLKEGGVVVEIRCAGQPPLAIATLDPTDDDFSDKLAEAESRADDRAAALNAALPRGR
jgi:hypothetical protein